MNEPTKQPTPPKPELRLTFQCSIPFETTEHAEDWYKMLKEMVFSQSPKSTLYGQIIKPLEPCCGDKTKNQLPTGVAMTGPPPLR